MSQYSNLAVDYQEVIDSKDQYFLFDEDGNPVIPDEDEYDYWRDNENY